MKISNEEIQLGLIVTKYEEALAKSTKSEAHKVLLNSCIDDLAAVNNVTRKTVKSYPATSSSQSASLSVDKKLDISLDLDMDLSENDLANYLTKCFGCVDRIQFQFQLGIDLDIGAQFKDLLENIKSQLELIKKSFDSSKDLSQLCSLLQLFNGIPCPQDLISLIMSLKVLLKKYAAASLKLKLDWFSLFGPLIEAIVQALGAATNSLFDIIEAPLNCDLGLITSNLALLRALDPKAFATSLVTNTSKSNEPVIGILDADTLTNFSVSTSDLNELYSKYKGDVLIPTSAIENFTIGGLLSKPKETTLFDLSAPEKVLVALNEAKKEIESFKKRILSLIANLNGLVHHGKILEIQNILAIIYITELISFLLQLVKYIGNSNFETLCSDKPEAIEALVKAIDPSYSSSVNKIDNGYSVTLSSKEQEIYINSCAKTTSVDLNSIAKLISNIEKVTNG